MRRVPRQAVHARAASQHHAIAARPARPVRLTALTLAWRRLAYGVRFFIYRAFFGSSDGIVAIGRGVVFGPSMTLHLGRNVWLGPYGIFQGEGDVRIGARTYVGSHFSINCVRNIEIGSDCMFGNMVSLIDNNHGTARGEIPFHDQPLVTRPILVEDGCWIGEKAAILSGVRIGRGSIVAAGAVVLKDVAAGTIVAGVPAAYIKDTS